MFVMRWKNAGRAGRHLCRGSGLALLVVAVQSGCSREFYREWANQDVSEAVFEKSRDPRIESLTTPLRRHENAGRSEEIWK